MPTLSPAGRVLLTRAELDNLRDELEALRRTHRDAFAERLRHAREFGVDHDDQLAAFEDAAVDEVKLKRLQRLIASATVIDDAAADGVARLASVIHVQDGAGRGATYELVGVRTPNAADSQVTPGSPMGQALLGTRAGDTVSVLLPNGRERSLTVLAVMPTQAQPPANRAAATGR